jgi:hypothetical protein
VKKIIRILFVTICLFIILQTPASASIQEGLVPKDDRSRVGDVDLTYNDYPMSNYELATYVNTDGDWLPWNWGDGIGKQFLVALMEFTNLLWFMSVVFSQFVIFVVQEAFTLDFITNVVGEISKAIRSIAGFDGGFSSKGLWPSLIIFMILLVGTWGGYVGLVKREMNRAVGGFISFLLVFGVSLGFFSQSDTILKSVNGWSSDIQNDVLSGSASIVNPGASYSNEEGIASVGNQMFDLMVHKPYLLLQYGTLDIQEIKAKGEGRIDDLLNLNPNIDGEEREEIAKEEVDTHKNTAMSVNGITERAGVVPLILISNLLIGIFLLIMAATILLYQILFLILALFAPVALLIALVPRWKHVAINWSMKLLHTQLMKIAIALLLTILFAVSSILYKAAATDKGFLFAIAMQIICFLGVWAKRHELFGMMTTISGNVQSSTGNTLQNYRGKYQQMRGLIQRGKNALSNNNLADRSAQKNLGYLSPEERERRAQEVGQTMKQMKQGKLGRFGTRAADLVNRMKNANPNVPGQDVVGNATDAAGTAGAAIAAGVAGGAIANGASKIVNLQRYKQNQKNGLNRVGALPLIDRNNDNMENQNMHTSSNVSGVNEIESNNRHVQENNFRDNNAQHLVERRMGQNMMHKQSANEQVNTHAETVENQQRNVHGLINRQTLQNDSILQNDNVQQNNKSSENKSSVLDNLVDRHSQTFQQNQRNIQDVADRESLQSERNSHHIREHVQHNNTTSEAKESVVGNLINRSTQTAKGATQNIQDTVQRQVIDNVSNVINTAETIQRNNTTSEAKESVVGNLINRSTQTIQGATQNIQDTVQRQVTDNVSNVINTAETIQRNNTTSEAKESIVGNLINRSTQTIQGATQNVKETVQRQVTDNVNNVLNTAETIQRNNATSEAKESIVSNLINRSSQTVQDTIQNVKDTVQHQNITNQNQERKIIDNITNNRSSTENANSFIKNAFSKLQDSNIERSTFSEKQEDTKNPTDER